MIDEISAKAGVDPALTRAIVAQASNFDPARIQDGAHGLMQIGAGTAAEWAAVHGVEVMMTTDLLDPRTNLEVGTWYLRRALDRWQDADDPAYFALADYAAGPEAVRAWAGQSKRSDDLRAAIKGTATSQFVEAVVEQTRGKP